MRGWCIPAMGTTHMNSLRSEMLGERFPGLLECILRR